jgi:hypothetical protein
VAGFKRDEVKAKSTWAEVDKPMTLEDVAGKIIKSAKERRRDVDYHTSVSQNPEYVDIEVRRKNNVAWIPVARVFPWTGAFEETRPSKQIGQKQIPFWRRDKDKDYVLDGWGQLTRRFVYRSITDQDRNNLARGQGIKCRDSKGNRDPAAHVAGKKETLLISTTATPGEITNAHGETFNQGMQVMIDLSYVEREKIFDVSTPVGEGRLRII